MFSFQTLGNKIKQNSEEVTYANLIKREDERIDFTKTKKQIRNQRFFLKRIIMGRKRE